ncbi:hypothetical protein HDE69_004670 [Pedobacter cryoconitis]|uniref:Uncharacterized protein n=1 Tax=Pedobacter cryoconitis TaxID=188932 RepID=A0A7W8YXD9_9SPHI|nr:hypothetical protein [Pedobacter cryoconitis]MBB5623584.1 hypothetical protein [Pedobacter cryoconitis]MBB5645412.1 hypothetical protein [Pedobacter cryoconitis]
MKKLRKLQFIEIIQNAINYMGGIVTNPNPYATVKPTIFVGETFHEGGASTPDNFSDTETVNDYELDQG